MSPTHAFSTTANDAVSSIKVSETSADDRKEGESQEVGRPETENNGETSFNSEASTIILAGKSNDSPATVLSAVEDTTDHKRKGTNAEEDKDEATEHKIKRTKISRITQSLWEGFGGEDNFDLRSGWLYDPRRWVHCG